MVALLSQQSTQEMPTPQPRTKKWKEGLCILYKDNPITAIRKRLWVYNRARGWERADQW